MSGTSSPLPVRQAAGPLHDWRNALTRAALGSAGPLVVAAAQFAAAILVWTFGSAAEFGLFSLLLVFVQLSFGLSNALVGAPLAVIQANADASRKRNAILAVHGLFLAALALLCFGPILFLAASPGQAALFACFAVVANLRWAARAWALAEENIAQSARSDFSYAAATVALIPITVLQNATIVTAVVAALAVANLVSLASTSRAFITAQAQAIASPELQHYRTAIWPEQARWATLGVVTTEASSNAHAYIVAAMFGPAGFAILAFGALFWRPLTVVLSALTQIDRARFARRIDSGQGSSLIARGLPIVATAWLGNALLAGGVLLLFAGPITAKGYDSALVAAIVAGWALIMALRAARNPLSTFLQAGRRFRQLAWCSVISAIVSVTSVGLFANLGASFTLLGVLVGEAVLLALVIRAARQAPA